MSAVLFIFYLSCALKESDSDKQVHKDLKAFIDVLYADDLTYATTSSEHRAEIRKEVPKKLEKYNLFSNQSKTEEGEAPDRRPPPKPPPPPLEDPGDRILWSELDWLVPPKMSPPEPTYKNIKLLGTKLDTKCDIEARKAKIWDPIRKFHRFFKSKRLSVKHKIRVYRTYIEPILLYNSETWILTDTQEKKIDSFHRRLLRICINVRYPKIIKSTKLYTLTQQTPLSDRIRARRLSLLGHVLRLDPDTPVQKSIQYYLTPHKRPVGRPVLTWIALVSKDLQNTFRHHKIKSPLTSTTLNKLKDLAADRVVWRGEIARCKERKFLISQSVRF